MVHTLRPVTFARGVCVRSRVPFEPAGTTQSIFPLSLATSSPRAIRAAPRDPSSRPSWLDTPEILELFLLLQTSSGIAPRARLECSLRNSLNAFFRRAAVLPPAAWDCSYRISRLPYTDLAQAAMTTIQWKNKVATPKTRITLRDVHEHLNALMRRSGTTAAVAEAVPFQLAIGFPEDAQDADLQSCTRHVLLANFLIGEYKSPRWWCRRLFWTPLAGLRHIREGLLRGLGF